MNGEDEPMTDQQADLANLEREFLERFLRTVSDLAKTPGRINTANWGKALGEDVPFMSYCSIIRQEQIAVRQEQIAVRQEQIAKAMQAESRTIKWLTWALVVLTAALAVLTTILWRGA